MPLKKISACLELCRVSNLPTVWISAVAAGILSAGTFSSGKVPLLLVALSLMYCGGMIMNDTLDAARDAVDRPDRPIPSGRISSRGATVLYAGFFATSLGLLAVAGGKAGFVAGGILLLLVLLYNLTHNASIVAIVPMAACRFMIYPVAGISLSGRAHLPLVALATVQFAYILMLTLVARREKSTRAESSGRSPIPLMLALIPVIDGVALGILAGPWWLLLGAAGGAATLAFHTRIRGD